MSGSTHVDTIRAAVAALNAGDIDRYLRWFAPSCQRRVPGLDEPRGLEEIAEDLRQLNCAFEPLKLEEDVLFGGDQFVCARWMLRGVHAGDFLGLAATNREVAVPTCEVYEFAGEQVVATWAYGDPLELLRQLGAVPASDVAQ